MNHLAYEQRCIVDNIGKAGRLHGLPSEQIERLTPVEIIQAAEELEEEALSGDRAPGDVIERLISIIVQGDPNPANVLKNFYALVHAFYPAAMFPIQTCEEYGLLFDQTRAAASWRVKQIHLLLQRGLPRGNKSRFQKSATACAMYSQLQRRRHADRTDEEHLP